LLQARASRAALTRGVVATDFDISGELLEVAAGEAWLVDALERSVA
jgi:hypothetical protein